MRQFLKIVSIILSLIICLFVILVIKNLIYPPQIDQTTDSNFNDINKIVSEKTGLSRIESIDQIKQKLLPLSAKLIAKKYPMFPSKHVDWHILEANAYKDGVLNIIDGSNIAKKRSDESNIGIDSQDAITFCPPTIFLKYLGDSRSTTQYLVHIIHESFHALSCNADIKKVLPPVWEEGMTDYFAIQTLSDYVGTSADSYAAFPYEIRVVKDLMTKIPESKIIEIYLSKDTQTLSTEINKAFGSGTYDSITVDLNIIFTDSSYANGFQANKNVDDALDRIEKKLI